MPVLPRAGNFDSTFAILKKRDGYDYIRRTCDRLSSDIFEARFMLKRVVCIRGAEAAKLFSDNSLFDRRESMPSRIQRSARKSAPAHGRRKRMILTLMTPESLGALERLNREHWEKRISKWVSRREISLLSETREVLFRSICDWAGFSLTEQEAQKRAQDLETAFSLRVDSEHSILAMRALRARLARLRGEAWARRLVREVRAGRKRAPFGSALHLLAYHRDGKGKLLDERSAAIELLNLLRPSVTLSYLVTFAGLALHKNPPWREKLRVDHDAHVSEFVHEVRRYFTFAPYMAARTRRAFRWKGFRFRRGRLVILDLFGTSRDPRVWDDADAFRPERFANRASGGVNPVSNPVSPSERMRIRLLEIAVECLTRAIAYEVPPQDLELPTRRFPALPARGFIIDHIRRINSMTSCRLTA